METYEMHQSNRAAWNEGAVWYEQGVEQNIAFLRAGGKNLEDPELRILHDLRVWCGRAVHLQCAGGGDTLSLWNQGAAEVVGVDISDRMIAVARQKSDALRAPATWYCCDVLDTPAELNGTADLVYTGRGALPWLHDLGGWADVVARLLKPGGRLFIFEGHPLTSVWDSDAAEFKLSSEYGNYFSDQVDRSQGWPATYIGELDRPVSEQAPKYERLWTLGTIVTTLAQTGLRLERLEEYPDQFWDQFPRMPADLVKRLPNTFSLLMRKE
ncbi:MAG: class I SAM-dependent methyltransferase [Herpetosiphon sp.]